MNKQNHFLKGSFLTEAKQKFTISQTSKTHSQILCQNLMKNHLLKFNSPNYQRKDPITHIGVVQEQEKDYYKPAKNNQYNCYTDNIKDQPLEKYWKKKDPEFKQKLLESQSPFWKPCIKQYHKQDQKIFSQTPREQISKKNSLCTSKSSHSYITNNPILQNHIQMPYQRSGICAGDQVISQQSKQLSNDKYLQSFEKELTDRKLSQSISKTQIFFENSVNQKDPPPHKNLKHFQMKVLDLKNVLTHEQPILKQQQLKESSNKITSRAREAYCKVSDTITDYNRKGQIMQFEEKIKNNYNHQDKQENIYV